MKKIMLIIFLFNVAYVLAQDYRFGKVSKEELLESSYKKDTTANAVVLYKEKKVHYNYLDDTGYIKITEVFERIKIYNKEGFKWANKVINLYNENKIKEENLYSLKAYTYNLENNKIIEDKLKNSGVFVENKNKYWKRHKFTLPNIKPGSVIEFKYRIESPFIKLDDDIFQYNIPIKKLNYNLFILEYFTFNKVLNSRASYVPIITESKKARKLEVAYNSSDGRSGSKYLKANRTEVTRDIIENVFSANLNDIPALKDEPFVHNLDNYRAIVKWELIRTTSLDKSINDYSNTWDQVTKTIYESKYFGVQLKKDNYYEDDINTLVQNSSNPLKKAVLIFNYVKSKVKWNGRIGYYSEVGVKKAYNNREGNVAEINLMLTSMLRYAGINASPVLISTRDNGIPILPSRSGFNYVISAIEIPDGLILLDAAHKYTSANILPKEVINWQGRIIREHGSSTWVSLKPSNSSNEVISLNIKINSDLSITGKVRKQLTNQLAMLYREEFYNIDNEQHIMSLEDGKDDIEISNLDIKYEKDLNKPVTYSYDYKLDNAIEEIGKQLYFSPLLFFIPKNNMFKQKSRLYPIDFIYPTSEKYKINIMLPDGYVVDRLPENSKIQFNGSEGEFIYLARENGKMLQFTMSYNINNTLIQPENYNQFNKFYQSMIDKQSEQIVLKKE